MNKDMNPGEVLRKISETLGMIEVRGKDNLSMLLGCIQAADDMADAMDRFQKTAEGPGIREEEHVVGTGE